MTDRHERAKWDAYADTVLEFLGATPLRIDLRRPVGDAERRAIAERAPADRFAVLTAENPRGENADDAPSPAREAALESRDRRRTTSLVDALAERGIPFARVDGVAPDGDYREHCVAVALDRAQATALARELDQLALFWYDGHDFWLLPAEADAEPRPLPDG